MSNIFKYTDGVPLLILTYVCIICLFSRGNYTVLAEISYNSAVSFIKFHKLVKCVEI